MRAVMSFSQRLVVLVSGRKIADGDAARGRSATPKSRGRTLASSLTIAGIHAAYGAVRVIEDVSLKVGGGETVVLLGTNGNGKSTLMKCIMGIVRPSAGRDHRRDRRHHGTISSAAPPRRSSISASRWCRKAAGCFRKLTVEENLLLGAFRRTRAREIDAQSRRSASRRFPRLAERRSQLAGSMSGGEQQMLALGARADVGAANPAGRRAVGRPGADPGRAAPSTRSRS